LSNNKNERIKVERAETEERRMVGFFILWSDIKGPYIPGIILISIMLVGETSETKAILFCPQGDYSLF
jgi:hypothetical protein